LLGAVRLAPFVTSVLLIPVVRVALGGDVVALVEDGRVVLAVDAVPFIANGGNCPAEGPEQGSECMQLLAC
jgi:hypothetical protein